MNNSFFNSVVGWLLIIIGSIILLYAAGELILRLIAALCAFMLIKQGLSLNGISVTNTIMRMWIRRRF